MTLAVITTSCESYDDYDTDRTTIVGFTRQNMNINGVGNDIGSTKSAEVDVYVSDISTSDRAFNITHIEIDDTEAFPPTDRENFDYDQTVTIPAGESVGSFTVTGINHTLTSERKYFRLAIEPDPNLVIGAATITIGLRK